MGKNKKATKKVAHDSVLTIDSAQQIIRNYQEDYGFVDILDRFMCNEFVHTGSIPICKTPNVLALGGANLEYDIIINPKTIAKCMGKADEWHHGHDLDKDIFKYLVFELRNPVMLLKGSKENTLVAVTSLKDRQGRPIVVSVALERRNAHHLANQITSAYGRNNFNSYLRRQVKEGNLIAINKNKANQMFRSAGLQLPIEETTISFDNSISYSFENVKVFSKESLEKLKVFNKENTDSWSVSAAEITRLFDSFANLLSSNEEVMDMIRFFGYAGNEIYSSRLWHDFQCDKEYLKDNEFVSNLNVVLQAAMDCAKEFKGGLRSKNKEFDKYVFK